MTMTAENRDGGRTEDLAAPAVGRQFTDRPAGCGPQGDQRHAAAGAVEDSGRGISAMAS
jgi:hypothetical protein